jgi:hypothetical protein
MNRVVPGGGAALFCSPRPLLHQCWTDSLGLSENRWNCSGFLAPRRDMKSPSRGRRGLVNWLFSLIFGW